MPLPIYSCNNTKSHCRIRKARQTLTAELAAQGGMKFHFVLLLSRTGLGNRSWRVDGFCRLLCWRGSPQWPWPWFIYHPEECQGHQLMNFWEEPRALIKFGSVVSWCWLLIPFPVSLLARIFLRWSSIESFLWRGVCCAPNVLKRIYWEAIDSLGYLWCYFGPGRIDWLWIMRFVHGRMYSEN